MAVSAGRALNDGGACDEGAGGEDGESPLGEHAHAEAAGGGEFAEMLGGDALAGPGYPGDERWRGDGGDGGAQGGASAVEEPPDSAVADAEGGGDLLVAVPGEGGPEDDLALHVRERGHVGESLAQV